MRWKVVAGGEEPSLETVSLIADITSLLHEDILSQLADGNLILSSGLLENEAQKLADTLGRHQGISCKVLPDSRTIKDDSPKFRIVLVDFRPGYRTRLRRTLQKLTGLPHEQIVQWLSRMPFSLGSGVDSDSAKRIRKFVTDAGGIVRVEAESSAEERASRKFRTTAVFNTPSASVSAGADITEVSESEKQKDTGVKNGVKAPVKPGKLEPPVLEFPEGLLPGPPPSDGIDGPYGRLMRTPTRFHPGEPLHSLMEGYFKTAPPIITQRKVEKPSILTFDDPPSILELIPEVIGGKGSLARGPFPKIIYYFPPDIRRKRLSLLPPIIRSGDYPCSGMNIPPVAVSSVNNRRTTGDHPGDTGGNISYSTDAGSFPITDSQVLKLYVCPPPMECTEDVATAISDVLGFSLDKSRNLLAQSPACLARYWSDQKAREIAHRLEQRGVSVSITRGQVSSSGESYSHFSGGFQAWLTANG